MPEIRRDLIRRRVRELERHDRVERREVTALERQRAIDLATLRGDECAAKRRARRPRAGFDVEAIGTIADIAGDYLTGVGKLPGRIDSSYASGTSPRLGTLLPLRAIDSSGPVITARVNQVRAEVARETARLQKIAAVLRE